MNEHADSINKMCKALAVLDASGAKRAVEINEEGRRLLREWLEAFGCGFFAPAYDYNAERMGIIVRQTAEYLYATDCIAAGGSEK